MVREVAVCVPDSRHNPLRERRASGPAGWPVEARAKGLVTRRRIVPPFGPSSRIAFTVIAEGHMRVRHLTHGIELIRDASDHIITLEGVAEVVC